VEALPIGNGHLGAMVFGKTDDERLQLNDNTLYSGEPDIPWKGLDNKTKIFKGNCGKRCGFRNYTIGVWK
jgi:alpha-L-fucosidase 2